MTQKALAIRKRKMHYATMRTHTAIVSQAGADHLVTLLSRPHKPVSIHTVRSWRQRDSIPAEHWAAIAAARLATLDELAHAAAKAA